MLDVESEKLTERERECLKHFRQAQELGSWRARSVGAELE
jgi:hypothetical protein